MKIPNELRDTFPVWHEGDGPAPFVYAAAEPGHMCAWTCRWTIAAAGPGGHSAGRMIDYRAWGVEDMTIEQIAAELRDISARPGLAASRAVAALAWKDRTPEFNWLTNHVARVLEDARIGYPEFVYPPLAPRKIWIDARRPCWAALFERGTAALQQSNAGETNVPQSVVNETWRQSLGINEA